MRALHPGRPTPGRGPLNQTAFDGMAQAAGGLLVDVIDIGVMGEPGFDPDTLEPTDGWEPVHLDVPALIEPDQPRDRTVEFGDAPVYVGAMFVSIPNTVTGVTEGMQVRVRQSRDPDAVGRKLTVRDPEYATTGLLRQLVCIDTNQEEPSS